MMPAREAVARRGSRGATWTRRVVVAPRSGSAHTRIGRRAGDSLGATALRARAGAPRPRPMSDILTLLQGSRQLQAEIHDESQLPPVARSLQQIQEETRARQYIDQQVATIRQ